MASLYRHGFLLGVATNQSGVARGLVELAALEGIHALMRRALRQAGGEFGSIRYCPHGPDSRCGCRKPAPGLLLDVAADLGVRIDECVVIGDSLRDMQAALRAGAEPVLVRTGNGGRDEGQARAIGVERVFANLPEAAAHLIELAGTSP